jgi:hypothetical protein
VAEPKRKTRTFDDSRNGIASAKAYAKGVHERLGAPADTGRLYPQVTLRELFDRYIDAGDRLADATAEGKRNHWRCSSSTSARRRSRRRSRRSTWTA